MSRRAPVLAHALEQHSNPDWLPAARDVVLPELIGGLSGAPLAIARWFHHFLFEYAELAVAGDGWIVLQDVVIGRPSPLLREIQLWGSTVDRLEMLRMTPDDIADVFGLDPVEQRAVCTERLLWAGAFHWMPCMGDDDLERRIIANLLVSATSTLATVAPYVRIGDGVVWAYRASNMLTLVGRTR